MITPRIVNEGLPSEIIEWDGKTEEGDAYPDFCCKGFDAKVVLILFSNYFSCANLECPKDKGGLYPGITTLDDENLALWLIDQQEACG